jgi:hypothetical protein
LKERERGGDGIGGEKKDKVFAYENFELSLSAFLIGIG